MSESLEKKSRDLLRRLGVERTHRFTNGDLVELANMFNRITELEAQLADAKEDAERYQWLRTNDDWSTTPRSIVILYDGDSDVLQQGELDEAIDNAIQAEGKA